MPIQPHAPAADASQITAAPIEPGREWIRPADGRQYVGLSRSLLYELINEGKIRSVCLRRKGRATGVRLISVSSLLQYIESQGK